MLEPVLTQGATTSDLFVSQTLARISGCSAMYSVKASASAVRTGVLSVLMSATSLRTIAVLLLFIPKHIGLVVVLESLLRLPKP